MKSAFFFVFLVLAMIRLPFAAFAETTWIVDQGGDGDFLEIQEAIDAASDGDSVVVRQGSYFPIDFKGKAITVRSQSGPDVTTISTWLTDQAVAFTNGEGDDSVISGFKLNGNNLGSAVVIHNASPILEKNLIETGVRLNRGGGIYVDGGSPVIRSNVIRNNEAVSYPDLYSSQGGGIYYQGDGAPEFVNNYILNNTAQRAMSQPVNSRGGGIFIQGGSPRIIGNVIAHNVAVSSGQGGGIYLSGTDGAVVSNNTIYRNRARMEASGGGAGIRIAGDNSNQWFANNIIQENEGLGVQCESGAGVSIRENSLYGNEDGDYQDCPAAAGDLLVDAQMVDPQNGEYHLQAGSPCIDAGDNTVPDLPTADIDGNARVLDGDGDGFAIVDMGADEFAPPVPAWGAAATLSGDDSVKFNNILVFGLLFAGLVLGMRWRRNR